MTVKSEVRGSIPDLVIVQLDRRHHCGTLIEIVRSLLETCLSSGFVIILTDLICDGNERVLLFFNVFSRVIFRWSIDPPIDHFWISEKSMEVTFDANRVRVQCIEKITLWKILSFFLSNKTNLSGRSIRSDSIRLNIDINNRRNVRSSEVKSVVFPHWRPLCSPFTSPVRSWQWILRSDSDWEILPTDPFHRSCRHLSTMFFVLWKFSPRRSTHVRLQRHAAFRTVISSHFQGEFIDTAGQWPFSRDSNWQQWRKRTNPHRINSDQVWFARGWSTPLSIRYLCPSSRERRLVTVLPHLTIDGWSLSILPNTRTCSNAIPSGCSTWRREKPWRRCYLLEEAIERRRFAADSSDSRSCRALCSYR